MPYERDPHDSSDPRIEVRADWSRLAAAFSDDSPGVEWYLHVPSGEVVRVAEGDAPAAERGGDGEGDRYLPLERARSKEQYRWMERFIVRLHDRALAAELAHAIAGKRAFQRFKVVLGAHPGRTAEWFEFRNAELTRFVSAWLEDRRLFVPWKPAGAREAGAREAVAREVGGREAEAERNGGGGAVARGRLESAADALEAEEVEALVRMGEFLLASAGSRP